jgi:hypothetical protein
MNMRDQIVEEAKKWLDVPWRHQGRTQRGIDCAGLILQVGNSLNLCDYHVTRYPRNTHRDHFVDHFHNIANRKPVKDRQQGDMLLFRDGLYACHCGFLEVEHGVEYVIHAYYQREKTVRERLNDDMIHKLTHCFEFKGVTGG